MPTRLRYCNQCSVVAFDSQPSWIARTALQRAITLAGCSRCTTTLVLTEPGILLDDNATRQRGQEIPSGAHTAARRCMVHDRKRQSG